MSSGLEATAAIASVEGPTEGQNPVRTSDGAAGGIDRAKRDLAQKLAPRVIDVRNRRRPIDEDDLNAHAAWSGKRTRYFYNSDTFKHYIPAARRAAEQFTTRVVQMLTPNDQFFEVYPGDELSIAAGKQAASIQSYMDWLLTEKIDARDLASQCTRCLLIFRRCIVKTGIKVTDVRVKMGRLDSRVQEVWPTAYVVDPFSFYCWPETVSDPEDASLVFEDVMMPYSDYADLAKQKLCDPIQRSELTTPEWPYHQQTRLSLQGLTTPETVAQASTIDTPDRGVQKTPNQQFVAVSECWFKVAAGQWMVAWIVWNAVGGYKVTRLKKAEGPRIPYRYASARPIPGQLYTSSLMSDIEPLQILLNDQFNQSEEARSVAALPPIAVDPNLISRNDSMVYGSRKLWLVEDPNKAIRPIEIPDTSGTSQRAAQNTLGLINSIGGPGQLASGQPIRGLPRAGQAVQNMISLGLADVQDVAAIIESKILSPLMGDLHQLTVAYVPESQIIQIPGAANYQAQSLTVEGLFGNWKFKWMGSQQSQQLSAKGQQTLVLFQGLTRSAGILQEQGWAINWGPLVKRIWRDTLGERGLEQIIVPISELQKVNPAAADGLKLAQQMAQAQAAAGAKPHANITLRGELDPQTSKDIANGQPIPPGPAGAPSAAIQAPVMRRPGGGGKPMPMGPANTGDVLNQLARVTATPSPGQQLGGG